jgi:hypothetical protein
LGEWLEYPPEWKRAVTNRSSSNGVSGSIEAEREIRTDDYLVLLDESGVGEWLGIKVRGLSSGAGPMAFLRGTAHAELELEIKLLDCRRVVISQQSDKKDNHSNAQYESDHPLPWKKFKARAKAVPSTDAVPFPILATADLLQKIDTENLKHGGVALGRAALTVVQQQDVANRCAIVRVRKSRIQTESGQFTIEETDLDIQVLHRSRNQSLHDGAPSSASAEVSAAQPQPTNPITLHYRSWCVESSGKVTPSSREYALLTAVGNAWGSKKGIFTPTTAPPTAGAGPSPVLPIQSSIASYPKFLYDLCSGQGPSRH